MPRPRRCCAAVALILGGLLCLSGGPASGHQQFAPSTVNRYGKLILSGQHGLRLLHTLMVGATPAAELRRENDRNHNGRLDPSEQSQLCAELGRRMREGLSLSLDGRALLVVFDAPQCIFSGTADKPSDSLGELPFSVELAASLKLSLDRQEHTLRYEDRIAAGPIGEVELRVEEGPDVALLASFQGAPPPSPAPQNTTVQRQFQTLGPPRSSMSDRSISLRFAVRDTLALAVAAPARRWLSVFLAILLAAALLSAARRLLRPAQ